MATKSKPHPLNGMHTAGIFSDMSIDGPEIGTLVVVVDRAKNLPNRKTIGKQDPYCAARLGKEAKKTTTDIRGGQTPKDQELRFTVHDSPDYYQLKVSVFNDDKKTDLIGEAWIDLRDIVVSGGGQSDHWHQLGCRGKYAGEVRIEITYYDSRPKPEKPPVKAKPPAAAEEDASPAVSGARSMPKRRPLPFDTVSGKSPAALSPGPEQTETPTRPQPNPAPVSFIPNQSPLQQIEYNTAPPAASPVCYPEQPDPRSRRETGQDFGTPSRRVDAPAQQYRTPERRETYAVQPDDQGYSPHHHQPTYDHYDAEPRDPYSFQQVNNTGSFEDDRPPPPPAHRSRTGSNSGLNASFQGTPPTMRQDVLRSEAHRHSASASYPGRPTYKAYDSAPPALLGPQFSSPDQPPSARHYSYDSSYDMPQRAMQPTVEDVPESPESLNNSFSRSSGRWPQPLPPTQPQSQFDRDFEMTASPAPLNLGGRASTGSAHYSPAQVPPDQPRRQPQNGYQMHPSEVTQGEPQYPPSLGRHSEPSLASRSSQGNHRALTYRSELDDTSNGYAIPPVPPSLVPGIDPSIAQDISERINQERRQVPDQTRRYTQQAPVETPPRGRTMDHRYDQDGSPAHNAAPPAHSRSPVTYTNGPSTSSVNVVIRSRAYSPNPVRDPSPSPHQQHTIRRKSVSPHPPPADSRRMSGMPFGPDSYDALNPSVSSAAIKDPAASRPDYREETGKIITHDGREVDPSDHLPMETWAPEPEPKNPKPGLSTSPSARPSPSGPQAPPPSGRRPLRVAGRPHSMLPSTAASGGYAAPADHVEPATAAPSPPVSTGRNRLQKKSPYRTSTSALPPVMSGANGPGSGPAGGNGFRRSSGGSGEASPLTPIPPHQDNFTPPRHLARAATFDYVGGGGGPGSENYAPHAPAASSAGGGGPPPPIPAKVPLALPPPAAAAPVMSGALQLHSSSVARRAGSGIDDGYFPGGGGGGRDHYWQQRQQQQQQHDGYDGYGGGGYGGGYGYGGGAGGSQELSLEEELRQIDIGTGRSSRKHAHDHHHHAHAHAQAQAHQAHVQQGYAQGGYAYGQGGY